MAYPIKLFNTNTAEGKQEYMEFSYQLDETLTQLFGKTHPNEKLRKYNKYAVNELPGFLKELAEKGVKSVVKELPGGTHNWKGSIGIYGRKTGSMIKKEQGLVYRMIVHTGDMELYYLNDSGTNGLKNEPIALPTGYALLCAPGMIDKVDIRVKPDPHRKNLSPKLIGVVPRIRSPNYFRCTVVLDLMLEGLEFPKMSESENNNDTEKDNTETTTNT